MQANSTISVKPAGTVKLKVVGTDSPLAGAGKVKPVGRQNALAAIAGEVGDDKKRSARLRRVCQIETGKRKGAIKTVKALAQALGVTLDDLQD